MRRRLVSAFKWAWDNHLSKHKTCRFVLCGSVSSFMVRNVLKSSALYGRVDLEINVQPLLPVQAMAMLGEGRSMEEIIDIYMVLGGIPQYLLELSPQLSLVQNLAQMAFRPNGYFTTEYQRLFSSHFGSDHRYERLIAALADKPVQTLESLTAGTGLEKGGTFSHLVEDLVIAGFVQRSRPLGQGPATRQSIIRLNDEFLHFYFSFVKGIGDPSSGHAVDATALLTGPRFAQWQGYAFERLCIKHAAAIARALGFAGISYRCGPWQATYENRRVAIDLVFERADKVVTACEIKYVNSLDGRTLVDGFARQIEILRILRPRAGIQKVLILGKKIPLPEAAKKYFDTVLYAADVFLCLH